MQSNCIEVLFRENIFVIERLHLKYISMYVASNVVDKKKSRIFAQTFLNVIYFYFACMDLYARVQIITCDKNIPSAS